MKKCDHRKYNKNCKGCKNIDQYCAYAEKEGYATFSDYLDSNGKRTDFMWKKMREYYNWGQAHEEDEQEPDQHEIEHQYEAHLNSMV